MSSIRPRTLRLIIAGASLLAGPAFAVVQSSCPDPCVKPPRQAIFGRETYNQLDNNAYMTPLTGTLLKGSARTVVRVDTTVTVSRAGGLASFFTWASINGKDPTPSYDGHGTACADTHPYCTLSMTLWFDIDELEAKYPGMFVGQPLNIVVGGNALTGGGAGASYWATFAAQVVKNR